MSTVAPLIKPMCFVAMPFGKKAPPGKKKLLIDFNNVHRSIAQAVTDQGLECVRADFELSGGFVQRPMFERLLVAEYVVADLTYSNPNVTYELGVRHGGSIGTTILVCEASWLDKLPFDHKPFRVLPYRVSAAGKLTAKAAAELVAALGLRIQEANKGIRVVDNPIVQVTQLRPSVAGHEKTDVFAQRMEYASDIGGRVKTALQIQDPKEAISALKVIEKEVINASTSIRQLHTAVVALYLGYRAKSAFEEMVALYPKMSAELRDTPMAREQLALANNRLAEAQAKACQFEEADRYRTVALDAIGVIPLAGWTSETYGIAGRIYKGLADAETKRGRGKQAAAALSRAITEYENGLRADPRDYFPGVNAITLRVVRNRPEDTAQLDALLAVVRFSVTRAPQSSNDDERYWRTATRLELACAARDWKDARAALEELLPIPVAGWMRETTADNLDRQAKARKAEAETVCELGALSAALRS